MKDTSTLPGGRLPLLDPSRLEGEQQSLYELLNSQFVSWANGNGFAAATDDGRLIGPFNSLLFSPGITPGFVALTNAEATHTSLSKRVREVVILSVGAVWRSAVARTVGLPDDVIDALVRGESPAELAPEEQVAHRFTRQLVAEHKVAPELYREAETEFGQTGLVDMIYLIGMYLLTCALLNAFEVPAPPQPA